MNDDKMRKDFEAAVAKEPRLYSLTRSKGGEYYDHEARMAWRIWQAATRAAVPAWQPVETMPNDDGSRIVADAKRGYVAPYIRGIIHNNTGSMWDWQYGEAITHWMPLPAAPEVKP